VEEDVRLRSFVVAAVFSFVVATAAEAAGKKVVASGFSGDFEDADTPIYATVKAWQTGNAAASSTLSNLVAEGWDIKQVVKTNGSAQTIQLLFIFEIDADKYPSTTFGKLKSEPKKEGSSSDM
jgi:hypothetical protein